MSKKNLILGGILIVLVAFAYIWSGPAKDWKESRGREKNFLADVSSGKVKKIEIEKSNGTKIVLEKSGESWKIGGTKNFYVSSETVTQLNAILSELGSKEIEVMSTSLDKKSSFGTDESGLKVKITEEKNTFDFVIGKTAPDFSGSFISQAGSNKTFKISADLNSIFGREEWRDLTVFSFIKERTDKIRFQYPSRQFTVEKKENKWAGILPKSFTVSEEKISTVLSVLEKLQAAKIPEQTFAGTGLEKHSIIVQVTGEGFDHTLMIGNCTKDNFCYAKRGDSDNIYLISKTDRDALDKKFTDFK
jgi:hypothetical protein